MRSELLLFSGITLACLAACSSSGTEPLVTDWSSPMAQAREIVHRVDRDDSYDVFTDKEWTLLFKTVYGEARNQSEREIKGIVNVIYNRWQSGYWGSTITDVLLAPKQFSVWNYRGGQRYLLRKSLNNAKYRRVQRITREVIYERISGRNDITHSATHFYHPNSMPRRCQKHRRAKGKRSCKHLHPEWHSDGPRIRIGSAIFVRIPLSDD